MTHFDRRGEARQPAALVPARLRFNQPLQLLDLSLSGARVETPEWVAPGRRYDLRLGGSPELLLSAVVMRCALVRVDDDAEGGRAVFAAGMCFQALPEATVAGLRALLGRLGNAGERPALPLASGY